MTKANINCANINMKANINTIKINIIKYIYQNCFTI